MSVELPLGYPSPATVDQTGDISGSEFTTTLSGDISAPEDFNNFVSLEPVFPTKPSRGPFLGRSPSYTEGYQSFTVPFNVLGSTSGPPKPEGSYLPPPADDSASNDLVTNDYEPPVDQAGTFTPPILLQPEDEISESEEADQEALSEQGKTQKIFP